MSNLSVGNAASVADIPIECRRTFVGKATFVYSAITKMELRKGTRAIARPDSADKWRCSFISPPGAIIASCRWRRCESGILDSKSSLFAGTTEIPTGAKKETFLKHLTPMPYEINTFQAIMSTHRTVGSHPGMGTFERRSNGRSRSNFKFERRSRTCKFER
jgi:hypothetical protein